MKSSHQSSAIVKDQNRDNEAQIDEVRGCGLHRGERRQYTSGRIVFKRIQALWLIEKMNALYQRHAC